MCVCDQNWRLTVTHNPHTTTMDAYVTTHELARAVFDPSARRPGSCGARDVAGRWPHLFSEKLCDLGACRTPVEWNDTVTWKESERELTVAELIEFVKPHVCIDLTEFKAAVIAGHADMQRNDAGFYAPVVERLTAWPDAVWAQLRALARASSLESSLGVEQKTRCAACGDGCRWGW